MLGIWLEKRHKFSYVIIRISRKETLLPTSSSVIYFFAQYWMDLFFFFSWHLNLSRKHNFIAECPSLLKPSLLVQNLAPVCLDDLGNFHFLKVSDLLCPIVTHAYLANLFSCGRNVSSAFLSLLCLLFLPYCDTRSSLLYLLRWGFTFC